MKDFQDIDAHLEDWSALRAAVDAYERQILTDTMARCRFNQKIAAEALGLSYDQIRHALKKHGLNQ